MKTLALVFQNADTPQVIDLMRRTFEEVFARSVQVEVYFMDRIGETEQICADVLVVNSTVSLLALRPHTPSFQHPEDLSRQHSRHSGGYGRSAGQRHAGQCARDDRYPL